MPATTTTTTTTTTAGAAAARTSGRRPDRDSGSKDGVGSGSRAGSGGSRGFGTCGGAGSATSRSGVPHAGQSAWTRSPNHSHRGHQRSIGTSVRQKRGLADGPRQGHPTVCCQQWGPGLYWDRRTPHSAQRRPGSVRAGASLAGSASSGREPSCTRPAIGAMIIASVSSGAAPPDLVVVGDVMLDVRVEAPALATGGDVPGSVRIRPGGGGANAAVWAASVGARVVLQGAVGDDPAGRLLLGALWERGVQAPLRRSADRATGTMLVVSEAGERSMVSDRGANAVLDERLTVGARGARALLVSAYALFDARSEAAARRILADATSDLVAVDVASWPLLRDYGPARFLDATATANVLLLNEREAEAFAPDELTRRYRDVFVKLGGGGVRHGRAGRWTSVTAPEVAAPRDTTGAGDAFAGVLLAKLARGQEVRAALDAACAAGAEVAQTGESWPVRPR